MTTDIDAADMAEADLTKWPDNFSMAWTRAATGWTLQEYTDKKQHISDMMDTRFRAVHLVTRDFIQMIKDSLWSADEDQKWVHKLATTMRGQRVSLSELRLAFYTLWVLCIMIENRRKPKSALSRSGAQKGSISETLVNIIEESNIVSRASRELGQPTMVSNRTSFSAAYNGSVWDLGYLRITMPQLNKPRTIPFAAFKPITADHYSDYINFQHETLLAALRSYHVSIDPKGDHKLVYRSVNGKDFDLLDTGGFHCTLGDWASQPRPSSGLSPLDATLRSNEMSSARSTVQSTGSTKATADMSTITTRMNQRKAALQTLVDSTPTLERESKRKRRRLDYISDDSEDS